MNIDHTLDIIEDEARQADEKAAEACQKSKYSTSDYWICLEFALQRLHDRIAAEAGSSRRCPHFPYRLRLAEFRRSVIEVERVVA